MSEGQKPAAAGILKNRKGLIVVLAFLSLYLFWGGTYLGMKVAIETMPPFIMAGFRFLTAGLLLYIIARAGGQKGRLQENGKAPASLVHYCCWAATAW